MLERFQQTLSSQEKKYRVLPWERKTMVSLLFSTVASIRLIDGIWAWHNETPQYTRP